MSSEVALRQKLKFLTDTGVRVEFRHHPGERIRIERDGPNRIIIRGGDFRVDRRGFMECVRPLDWSSTDPIGLTSYTSGKVQYLILDDNHPDPKKRKTFDVIGWFNEKR
jgi:hypothetical protein